MAISLFYNIPLGTSPNGLIEPLEGVAESRRNILCKIQQGLGRKDQDHGLP